MKKSLLRALPLIIFLLLVSPQKVKSVSALEIAADANFSSPTLNFSPGQTIYVRITTDNAGDDKKQLNLMDNQYNFIKSFIFSKTGSNPFTFTASLSAPSTDGYYSLEARIETAGSQVTSVKTIKVGSSANANVKVNISNRVVGQNKTSSYQPSSPPDVSINTEQESASPTSEPRTLDNPDVTFDSVSSKPKPNILVTITIFFKNLFSKIWFFK